MIRKVLSYPNSFLIRNGKTKSILRDSMVGIVPDSIINRTDKIGFKTPEGDWIKSAPFKRLIKDWFFNSKPICNNFVNLDKFKKQVDDHNSNLNRNSKQIWKTIMLECWLREFKNHIVHD